MPTVSYGFYAQTGILPYTAENAAVWTSTDTAATPDGGMVIVYSAAATDTPGAKPNVYLQKIDKDGALVGEPVLIATAPNAYGAPAPAVAVTADGRIGVVWETFTDTEATLNLQVLNADLTLHGPPHPVPFPVVIAKPTNTVTPEIIATQSGDFDIILVIGDQPGMGTGPTLHRVRMDADTGEQLAYEAWNGLTFSQHGSTIATLNDGRFVIAATSNTGFMRSEIHSFAPPAVVADLPAGQSVEANPQVIALRDGGYAIAWRTTRYDPVQNTSESNDIAFRIYNQDGSPRTGIIHANSDASVGTQTNPAIAELPNGILVVTWMHGVIDTIVGAAAFDAQGNRLTPSIAVSEGKSPNLVTLGDGTLGFEWYNGDLRGEYRLVDLARQWAGDDTAEHFEGDIMRDIMLAGAGNDTILALGGDDAVVAGLGDDWLDGGDGDDLLAGEQGNDLILGGAGDDLMEGGDGIDIASYAGAAAGVTVSLLYATPQDTFGAGIDTLLLFENLEGSAFADTLVGDHGANGVHGAAGDDWLVGLAGDDLLEGGAGVNVLLGGDGVDLASYASQTANLWIDMPAGVYSAAGVWDVFWESIEGVHGGFGADTIFGNASDNLLRGAAGNDALIGNAGADRLEGGDGDDWLVGGDGDDRLVGGAGIDVLTAGAGADTFDLGAAAGWDVAFDFRPEEDRFSLGGHTWSGFFVIDADGDGQVDDTLLGYAGGNFVALDVAGLTLDQWNARVDMPAGAAPLADADPASLAAPALSPDQQGWHLFG